MNHEVQLNLPLTDSSVGLKDAKPIIRVRRVLNSWKSLKFAQQFSRPEKKKNRKWRLSLLKWYFFFQSYNKCFSHKWNSFRFSQILFNPARSLQRIMKKALFLRFLEKRRNVLITRFDNLEAGKRNYCFGKKSGKRLELWIQKYVGTLYNSSIIWRSLL